MCFELKSSLAADILPFWFSATSDYLHFNSWEKRTICFSIALHEKVKCTYYSIKCSNIRIIKMQSETFEVLCHTDIYEIVFMNSNHFSNHIIIFQSSKFISLHLRMYIFSSNSNSWILVLISWILASKNFILGK